MSSDVAGHEDILQSTVTSRRERIQCINYTSALLPMTLLASTVFSLGIVGDSVLINLGIIIGI